MSGRFIIKSFAELNINDRIFDTLKRDYPGTSSTTGFIEWFQKKAEINHPALVFEDEQGLGAFLVTKDENEEIQLKDRVLPHCNRIKISTFKIADRYKGQRIGEGAIGLVLWEWQKSKANEIYLTVFEQKQTELISLISRFGFYKVGTNNDDEAIYLKHRTVLSSSDPYKSFPFIQGRFDHAGYVIIDDVYHDTMFAYSELARNSIQDKVQLSVTNGLSKIYVGKAPYINYYIGEPVFVYRRYTQGEGKRYKSCVTSYCIVTNALQAKKNNKYLMSFDVLLNQIGNKSVFDKDELLYQYNNNFNVTVLELLYCGYFGSGNNVNMDWLDKNGYWAKSGQYPTDVHLSIDQFKKVLMEGKVDVQNVIIN